MINTSYLKYNLGTVYKSLAAFCEVEWIEIKDNIVIY